MAVSEAKRPRASRLVLGLVLAMALVGGISLGSLWWMSKHVAPASQVPATAAYNSAPRRPVTAATAAAALLAFRPASDTDTVQAAILTATGQHLGPDGRFPGRIQVAAGPDGRFTVTVTVPVNVAYLRRIGAITTGRLPGASDLATGRLEVSGTEHVFAVDMNPKTHLAVFRFELSRDDAFLWPRNWNAVGVISQNDSLS
ncbi:MAG: hypothetical protein K6U14_04705 [Firmicutes bacterium]|nr:hypothetical protein [Alicyclobacillaceae bacterium]MCL6496920.1 hypothetical protein [Bacillota bacterium]